MSPSHSIRVMLVDDHTMVRRGLATFLKVFDDLELVGEADSGAAAIELCSQVLPDVILYAGRNAVISYESDNGELGYSRNNVRATVAELVRAYF